MTNTSPKYYLYICINNDDVLLREKYTTMAQHHNHTMEIRENILSNHPQTHMNFEIDNNGMFVGSDNGWASSNSLNSSQLHVDSGVDLFVPADQSIRFDNAEENCIYKLDHKVSCALFRKDSNGLITPSAYYMYPRSSISKTPWRLANSVGIIDSGYRGNLIAKFDPISHFEGDTHDVEPYSRLCQVCTPDLIPVSYIKIVDYLDDTTRGAGGFGSTGR